MFSATPFLVYLALTTPLPWGGKTSDSSSDDSFFFSLTDHELMLDCFLNFPAPQQMRYPLDLRWIQENQFEDRDLNAQRRQHPLNFPARTIDDVPLLCYRRDHLDNNEGNWRICIPSGLLLETVQFFHKALGHAGEVRVYDSIRMRFHHPRLKTTVENICRSCITCRKHKLQGPGYGELAA